MNNIDNPNIYNRRGFIADNDEMSLKSAFAKEPYGSILRRDMIFNDEYPTELTITAASIVDNSSFCNGELLFPSVYDKLISC